MKIYETQIGSDIGSLTIKISYDVIGSSGDNWETPYEPPHISIIDIETLEIDKSINRNPDLEQFVEEIEEHESWSGSDFKD